jgi:hypothetical protein
VKFEYGQCSCSLPISLFSPIHLSRLCCLVIWFALPQSARKPHWTTIWAIQAVRVSKRQLKRFLIHFGANSLIRVPIKPSVRPTLKRTFLIVWVPF